MNKQLYRIRFEKTPMGLFYGKDQSEVEKRKQEYLAAHVFESGPVNGFKPEYTFDNQAFWIVRSGGYIDTRPDHQVPMMSNSYYCLKNALTGVEFYLSGFHKTLAKLVFDPISYKDPI